jgi:hypothetical protein
MRCIRANYEQQRFGLETERAGKHADAPGIRL